MKPLISMIFSLLLCDVASAQVPQAEEVFNKSNYYSVYHPGIYVVKPDGSEFQHCHYNPVVFFTRVNYSRFVLKNVRDCVIVDAEARNLPATVIHCENHFVVKSDMDVYAHGDWVDIQGVAEVETILELNRESAKLTSDAAGRMELTHGSISWKRVQEENGKTYLKLEPSANIATIDSIRYYANNEWNYLYFFDDNKDELPSYDVKPRQVEVCYAEGTGRYNVPFRYRLSLSGAQLLPYVPNLKTIEVSENKQEPIAVAPAADEVYMVTEGWDSKPDGRCMLSINAYLFSDSLSIVSAVVKDAYLVDDSGTEVAISKTEIKAPFDSRDMRLIEITCELPKSERLHYRGSLELNVRDADGKDSTISYPFLIGFNIGGEVKY